MAGKDNVMADMLSRPTYQEKIEESMDDEEELVFFTTTPTTVERDDKGTFSLFYEEKYEGDKLFISWFLSTLMANPSWEKDELFDSQESSTLGYIPLWLTFDSNLPSTLTYL